MKIKEFMSQPVTVVGEGAALEEIARTMLGQNIGCVPVVDARGKISGIITQSDFAAKERGIPFSTFRAPQLFGQWMDKGTIERIYETARKMTAKEIMSHHVVTVTEDQGAEEAIELLLKYDVNRLPVVRAGRAGRYHLAARSAAADGAQNGGRREEVSAPDGEPVIVERQTAPSAAD